MKNYLLSYLEITSKYYIRDIDQKNNSLIAKRCEIINAKLTSRMKVPTDIDALQIQVKNSIRIIQGFCN